MNRTAILAVRIIGDAVSAVKAISGVDESTVRMERSMRFARLAVIALFGALLAGAIQVTGVASDMQQAAGAVEAVFTSEAEGIKKVADSAAQNVGIAEDQYLQLASVLGSQLKNLGTDQDELGGKTADLIELGADLSAMYGGTAADAVNALSSLLRGERDPIERYGVSIKQSDINARLAAEGLSELTGEAQKAAELQATLAILTEQTSSAQGRFAAEADTASGAQQRANAAWRDAQASLGEAFLPLVARGADLLSEFANWVDENHQLVLGLAIGLGVLAAAVVVITAAQWAFNVAALANPVGLVVLAIALAIGLLVAGTVLVIQHWQEIERVGQEAFHNVEQAILAPAYQVQSFTNDIIDAINWLTKLGSGQFLSDSVADLLGFDKVNYTAQLAHVDAIKRTSPAPVVTTTNITVNGALDTNGVATQIKDLLKNNSRLTGSVPAAGAP
jgi:hypothetical protein